MRAGQKKGWEKIERDKERERENKHDNAQIISLSDKNIAIEDS